MYLIALLSLLTINFAIGQDICRTPNGDAGICILLQSCEPLLEINRKSIKSPEDILYLRQAACGLHLNLKPKVCCPPKPQWTNFTTVKPIVFGGNGGNKPPPHKKPIPGVTTIIPDFPDTSDLCEYTIQPPKIDSLCCGKQVSSANKIIGGKIAEIDEFPWLAVIEYDSGFTGCGGSLISSRYVLTAAHCIVKTKLGVPEKVRLAEYNKTTYPTDIVEIGDGFEEITVVVFHIERQIRHPHFGNGLDRSRKHDIGLIKLAKNAPYTEFVRPICLPFEDIALDKTENLRFLVSGWGSNGKVFSDVKQYVDLPFVPSEKCQESYNLPRNQIELTDKHLCAGGEMGKDSCKGDSGGPLMHEYGDTYIIVGIVSFGDDHCGKKGVPGVYTHVYKYLDWILKEMV